MNMPKFSIITINYNNKLGLEKTIDSLLSQTYSDFEYIVIDGGSEDGSKEVIKKYSDRIKHWVSEKDTGIYNAMNKGIEKATGEYCLFLNSGDCLFKNTTLQQVYNYQFQEDVVYFDVMVGNKQTSQPGKISEFVLFTTTLCHQGQWTKTEILKKYNYNEGLKIVSDWELLLKIYFSGGSFKKIPIVFAYYDDSGISSSNKIDLNYEREKLKPIYFKENCQLYKEYIELKKELQLVKLSRLHKIAFYIQRKMNFLYKH